MYCICEVFIISVTLPKWRGWYWSVSLAKQSCAPLQTGDLTGLSEQFVSNHRLRIHPLRHFKTQASPWQYYYFWLIMQIQGFRKSKFLSCETAILEWGRSETGPHTSASCHGTASKNFLCFVEKSSRDSWSPSLMTDRMNSLAAVWHQSFFSLQLLPFSSFQDVCFHFAVG